MVKVQAIRSYPELIFRWFAFPLAELSLPVSCGTWGGGGQTAEGTRSPASVWPGAALLGPEHPREDSVHAAQDGWAEGFPFQAPWEGLRPLGQGLPPTVDNTQTPCGPSGLEARAQEYCPQGGRVVLWAAGWSQNVW